MNIISILVLALAISLDGLIAGLTYGLKGIKLTYFPLLIVSLASGFVILVSMSVGEFITKFLSPAWATRIGGVILLGIGGWLFYQALHSLAVEESSDYRTYPRELVSFRIPGLGLMVNILKEPITADLDYSGVISKQEAFILGIALALDAFGAGIGAAMVGYQPLVTSLAVAVSKCLMLAGGIYFGKNILEEKIEGKFKLVPGIILMGLGLVNLF